MLTRNYYKQQAQNATGVAVKYISYKNGTINANYSNGTSFYTVQFADSDIRPSLLQNNSRGQIVFGNGTAEPTLDDYTISGEMLSALTVQAGTSMIDYLDDGVKATRVIIIQNNTSSNFTISEVAWFNQSTPCLMDRTLLETPLTLAPGGAGQINYTIYFKYPV